MNHNVAGAPCCDEERALENCPESVTCASPKAREALYKRLMVQFVWGALLTGVCDSLSLADSTV